MSELQRYDDPHHNMEPCADGAWVMADDANKRIAALEAENADLKKAIDINVENIRVVLRDHVAERDDALRQKEAVMSENERLRKVEAAAREHAEWCDSDDERAPIKWLREALAEGGEKCTCHPATYVPNPHCPVHHGSWSEGGA